MTLVEILAVMAVITLLLGLLLPAISHVRKSARSTQCQSNLRQLSIAAANYANVNDGAYPPAVLYESSPQGMITIGWDFIQRPGGVIEPGPLWSFTDHPGEVQQDPLYDGPSNFGGDPFTGFNYNTTYIGAEGRFPELGPGGEILDGWDVVRRGRPPDSFARPAGAAVFGQGGYSAGANKFMRAPMNTIEGDLSIVYSGGQAFRSVGDTTNVAYLDAHVAAVAAPRHGEHATDVLLEQVMGFPSNGFLSDDDSAYGPR